MNRPVALTAGEPAGVGLELTGRAWRQLRGKQDFYLIADRNHVRPYAQDVRFLEIERPCQAADAMKEGVPLLHLPFPEEAQPGYANPVNAPAVVEAVCMAVRHVENGLACAVCTNPVSKEIIKAGHDFPFPGQTEFLGHLFRGKHAVMMLASPELNVVPATTHVPLAEVPGLLTRKQLISTLEITNTALRQLFGYSNPRLTVAGLNPHAGETGLFGREEIEVIRPVVGELAAKGMSVVGPVSADSMFHPEARTKYDAAVCMYHDQALIPFKSISFHNGVNVTLGLPILRTSPDHGPAFDIVGRGIARPDSLISSILLAGQLAGGPKQRE